MRSALQFILVTFLAVGSAQGQTQAGHPENAGAPPAASAADLGYIPASGSTEAAVTTSDPNTPWLPVTLNGELPTSAFAGELERSNTLRGGVTFATGYDDNALLENGKPVGNASFSFMPSLSLEQSRTHAFLDLSYNPGFTINQQLSQLNTNTQATAINFQYRFTQNLTVRVHDTFSSTNSPFVDSATSADSVPGSVLHQPSEPVLTPFANRTSNMGGVDLIDQLGERAILGGSASFSLLNYDNVAGGAGAQLIDSRSEGGELFYNHRVWSKQWIGVTYSFQSFTFNSGAEQTNSHSALLFYTIPLRSHVTLSLFGGATYSVTDGQVIIIPSVTMPASTQQWSPSGGMTLGWQGERTGMSATFNRSIAAGGGLFGTVDRYSGTVEVRRQLSRRWIGSLNCLYDNNRPIDFITANEFRTVAGGGSVERQIGQHLSFAVNYSRAHQIYGGLTAAQLFPDHNRAFVSISYLFNRPLGR